MDHVQRFHDRREAGQLLARRLAAEYEGDVISAYNIPSHVIRAVAEREGRELARQLLTFRGDRPLPDVRDRIAILADDGLATGSTMRAAVTAVGQGRPRAVVVVVRSSGALER